MTDRQQVETPYVGLVPYTEQDARFFFGRENDTKIVISNLFASRLTLLYGASGVGKTSVLRAGVIREFQDRNKKLTDSGLKPETAVVYMNNWKGDALATLKLLLVRALQPEGTHTPAVDYTQSLAQLIDTWTQSFEGDLMILFDQFEEYFLYQPRDLKQGFAKEFADAANDTRLPVSFLVGLRDDALSRLDRFKTLIPNLFSNYLRVRHLSREQAEDAIVKPVDAYNHLPADERVYKSTVTVEPELVKKLVDQVRQNRLLIGDGGLGLASVESTGIETPYLQLVLKKVWHEELGNNSDVLRADTLDRLGGAEEIVGKHLESVLGELTEPEREICSRMFQFLVTPGGTKIAHTADDLADFAKMEVSVLSPILQKLSGSKNLILSPVASVAEGPIRYEIYHDSLAHAILEWRKKYVEQQEKEVLRKQQRDRRTRIIVRVIVTAAMVILAVSTVALNSVLTSRDLAAAAERQRQAQEARARDAEAAAKVTGLAARQAQENAEQNARLAAALLEKAGLETDAKKFQELAKQAKENAAQLGKQTEQSIAAGREAQQRERDALDRLDKMQKELQQAQQEINRLKSGYEKNPAQQSAAVFVPSLIGRSLADAVGILQRLQLNIGQVSEQPFNDAGGRVLDQSPKAGTSVARGTSLDLRVSAPRTGDATLTLSVRLTGILVIYDGSSLATPWQFQIHDATKFIGEVPESKYSDDDPVRPRPMSVPAQMATQEGATAVIRVIGKDDSNGIASGQQSFFVKPRAQWTRREVLQIPVTAENPKKGSFVFNFEVSALPPGGATAK